MESSVFKHYRVAPGAKLHLARLDAGATPGAKGGKAVIHKRLEALGGRLQELQNSLWAEHRRRVLIVLQGMDTAGKDGTIAHVFERVNPLGVRAVAWKAPSAEQLDHDFLWRIHAQVPAAGEIVIFNRSHYEDVLVARVDKLVPREVWQARYRQINDFERLLCETGTTVLKFFLHIDSDEQKKRLEERLADPAKRWKLSREDLRDRRRWDDYTAAYEDALRRTSTALAPWYVVPANKKWYRNLVVASVLVRALERLHPEVPPAAAPISRREIDEIA
jgi:PPK2 family polyphosphate:nucleotide phosphotransferase